MVPRVTGLPPHTPRARAQTKTFHSPRPLCVLSPKGEETRVPLAPSHVEKKTNEARGHPRTRTKL